MTRAQLKGIVKECLLEILKEGLGNVVAAPVTETRRPAAAPQRQQSKPAPRRHSPLDERVTPRPAGRLSDPLTAAIKEESRGNRLMADIFTDTAQRTLPKMLSGGDTGNAMGEGASQVGSTEQFNGSPEQVFGEETAAKWASLAFMDPPAKKTA